jgi:hypothetical protein
LQYGGSCYFTKSSGNITMAIETGNLMINFF